MGSVQEPNPYSGLISLLTAALRERDEAIERHRKEIQDLWVELRGLRTKWVEKDRHIHLLESKILRMKTELQILWTANNNNDQENNLQGAAPENNLQGAAPENNLQGAAPENNLQGAVDDAEKSAENDFSMEQTERNAETEMQIVQGLKEEDGSGQGASSLLENGSTLGGSRPEPSSKISVIPGLGLAEDLLWGQGQFGDVEIAQIENGSCGRAQTGQTFIESVSGLNGNKVPGSVRCLQGGVEPLREVGDELCLGQNEQVLINTASQQTNGLDGGAPDVDDDEDSTIYSDDSSVDSDIADGGVESSINDLNNLGAQIARQLPGLMYKDARRCRVCGKRFISRRLYFRHEQRPCFLPSQGQYEYSRYC